jgi:hypothetical protein
VTFAAKGKKETPWGFGVASPRIKGKAFQGTFIAVAIVGCGRQHKAPTGAGESTNTPRQHIISEPSRRNFTAPNFCIIQTPLD